MLFRSDDRHYLEAITSSQEITGAKKTAGEKAGMAKSRSERIVWVKEPDGKLLRAVKVTLGLIEHQYAQLIGDDLREGDTVVTGIEGNQPAR